MDNPRARSTGIAPRAVGPPDTLFARSNSFKAQQGRHKNTKTVVSNASSIKRTESASSWGSFTTLPSSSFLLPQYYREQLDSVFRNADDDIQLVTWRQFLSEYSGNCESLRPIVCCTTFIPMLDAERAVIAAVPNGVQFHGPQSLSRQAEGSMSGKKSGYHRCRVVSLLVWSYYCAMLRRSYQTS